MKFYNIAENNIYVYGEIQSGFDAEWFARDLEYFGGKPIVVHINSIGGDVMSAIAMANALKNYPGQVNCSIEGICASSAVLISSACPLVTIAANSLMMTHPISVMLNDKYNSKDLSTVQDALAKVQAAYEQTVKPRLKKEIDFTQEIWYTAQEAIEYGLADKIAGEVKMQIDAAQDLIFVNKCVFRGHVPLKTASTPKANEDIAAQILGLIKDQMQSGAMNVAGGQNAPSAKEQRIAGIANFANGMV